MTEKDIEKLGTDPTLHAQPSVPPTGPKPEVEKTRRTIGCGAAAILALGMAGAGVGGTLGYQSLISRRAGEESSATKSANTEKPSENFQVETDMCTKIESDVDLRMALEGAGVKATAADFAYETSRTERQAKAIIMVQSGSAPNAPYKWQPATERITRLNQDEVLVAVKVVNPYFGIDYSRNLISEGLPYRARIKDESDPTITYFYYNCEDKKGQPSLLAQIGLTDPTHPKKLLWAKSFQIPECKGEEGAEGTGGSEGAD